MGDANEKITLQRDGQSIRIHIPLKFKRRGGRKEIIVADGLPNFPKDRTFYQKPLVVAFARAYRWQNLLDEGYCSSISDLARHLKVDRSYVSRMLHLTLLSLKIIDLILKGNEPSGLSLALLHEGVSLDWSSQLNELRSSLTQRF